MKAAVITFPGSNCDRDLAVALEQAGAEVTRVWHKDDALPVGTDLVGVPGGFSFGDYLRCGAIAAHSPIARAVSAHAARGGYVLGICNGFQVLCESHLLPGALIRNDVRTFVCRDQKLRVESIDTVWTGAFEPGQEITIVLKNGEGGFVADPETIARLEGENQVVFRYLDDNPNGSANDIAGITNERGNVVGLMPHPEHATEAGFGPDTSLAMRSGVDGLDVFTSAIAAVARVAA